MADYGLACCLSCVRFRGEPTAVSRSLMARWAVKKPAWQDGVLNGVPVWMRLAVILPALCQPSVLVRWALLERGARELKVGVGGPQA